MSTKRPNRTPRPGPRPRPYLYTDNHRAEVSALRVKPLAAAIRAIFGVHVVELGIQRVHSARTGRVIAESPLVLG